MRVPLRLAAGSGRPGGKFRKILQAAWGRGAVAVSAFTCREIALLWSEGRLQLTIPPRPLCRRLRVDGSRTIPVNAEIALRAAELSDEGFHGDPADG